MKLLKTKYLKSLGLLLIVLSFSIQSAGVTFIFVDAETGCRLNNVTGAIIDVNGSNRFELSGQFNILGEYDLFVLSEGYKEFNFHFIISENLDSDYAYVLNLDRSDEYSQRENSILSEQLSEDYLLYQVSVVDGLTREPQQGVKLMDDAGLSLGITDARGLSVIKISKENERINIHFEKEGYRELVSTELVVPNIYQKKVIALEKGFGTVYTFELDYYRNHSNGFQLLNKSGTRSSSNGNYSVCNLSSISVGFQSSSLSPCPDPTIQSCNYICGSAEVYTLDTYTKKVLPMEWLLGWQSIPNGLQAFKAGAVAIRTFGSWYVLHPLNNFYDICSSTCCQVIGTSTYSITDLAVDETSGFFLWDSENNEEARSEFTSEGNNLNPIDSDNCDCITNTCGCGNGYIGRSNTGSPCYYDAVGLNHEGYGHGRGMSQFGSARWASGLDLSAWCEGGGQYTGNAHGYGIKNWEEILEHYYGNYYSIIQCSSFSGNCEVAINQFLIDPVIGNCEEPVFLNVAIQNISGFTLTNLDVSYSIYNLNSGLEYFLCDSQGTNSTLQNNGFMGFNCEADFSEFPCGEYSLCFILSSYECGIMTAQCSDFTIPCNCNQPDVEITSIFFPYQPVVGEANNICVQITNIGSVTPNSDTDIVELYINDVNLGSFDGPVLVPNDGTSICIDYVFTQSGLNEICVGIEEHDEEINLENNYECMTFIVEEEQIEQDVFFSGIPQELSGSSNSTFSFAFDVCYDGDQSNTILQDVEVSYFLSTDCVLSAEDVLIGAGVADVGNNQSCVQLIDLLNLPTVASGEYYLIVNLDSNNSIQETNELNNSGCISLVVGSKVGSIDIGVENGSVSPNNPEIGDNILLGFDVLFLGGNTNLLSVTSGYYLSTDCTFDPNIDLLLTTETSEIGSSNLSQHESSFMQIPTNISEGNYYILFVVDNEFLISESNENNNVICLPIFVGSDCVGPAIPVFSNGNLITCPNGTVSINLVDNNSSYFWGLPDGWQCIEGCNSNSAIILPNASGTLAISGVNECSEVSSPLYLNIDIYEIFANAGEDITVCGQQTFQLVGQGGVEYSWSPGAYLDNPSSNFTEGEISQTTTFLLNVIDENGCTSMDEVTVYVESPEVSTSPMGLIEICQGEEIEISASEGQEYLWSTGEETQSIMVGMEGTYYCTILNPFDCIGEFNTPMVVVEYTEPQIIDLVINGNLLIAPVIGIGYNWYWNELPIAAFQDSQTCDVTLFGEGSYYVIVEQENGCLIESQVLNYLSVDDLNIENWKVYPNPAAESFLISGIKTYDQIYIFNSIGELIQFRTNSRDTLQINVSEWSVGLYEIVVSNDKTLSSKKLLIAR
ncbi:MAG: CARDB domain-containing protein [Flavobacteriales bacterium]